MSDNIRPIRPLSAVDHETYRQLLAAFRYSELSNRSYRQDRLNEFYRQARDSGFPEAEAASIRRMSRREARLAADIRPFDRPRKRLRRRWLESRYGLAGWMRCAANAVEPVRDDWWGV